MIGESPRSNNLAWVTSLLNRLGLLHGEYALFRSELVCTMSMLCYQGCFQEEERREGGGYDEVSWGPVL